MKPSSSEGAGPAGTDQPGPQFTTSDIFLGPEGLRAGWGILLFLLFRIILITAVSPLAETLAAGALGGSGPIPPRAAFATEAAALVCVLAATLLMARLEFRPMAAFGFARPHWLPDLCAGLAWGVALLSLLIALLRAAGLLVFDARLLSGGSAARYGSIWLAGFLLVGMLEESYLRGYLQFTLARGLSAIYRWLFGAPHAGALGFWTAALILSFIFGFIHRVNPGESPLGLLSAGLAGLLFCYSLWRTGSLWWAIGFHTAWDWAQSFLYGVADSGLTIQGHLFATHAVGKPFLSGGSTGPEGSLLLIPVIACGAVVVHFTLPARREVHRPAGLD